MKTSISVLPFKLPQDATKKLGLTNFDLEKLQKTCINRIKATKAKKAST